MCRGPSDQGAAEEGLPDAQAVPTIKEKSVFADEEKPALDSPRSWFVCAICVLAICGSSVGFRCSGLLLVSIAEEFEIPKGEASWPSSVVNLLMLFCGIVVGPLAQKYPLRPILFIGALLNGLGFVFGFFAPSVQWMTLGFGAVHGFGSGTILVAANVLLSQYFDRYRGLACGIAHAASPVSSMIFPSLFDFVKNHYGFRSAMLVIGVILMSIAPLALLVDSAPWAKTKAKDVGSKGSIFAWSVFREPMFYVILFVNIVFQWLFDTFLATIVDYGAQKGLTVENVVVIIGCYSVSDVIGRVLLPALADWNLIQRDTLITLSYFISCAFLILLCLCESLTSFIAAVSIFGGFLGVSSSYYVSIVSRYLGLERLAFSLGMQGTISGTVFLLMPSAIGLFRDQLGDYRLMYLMNAALLFLTSLPWIYVIRRRMIGRSLECA